MKIDLTWGDSVAIRENFLKNVQGFGEYNPVLFGHDLANLNYPPFEGDPILIEHTRQVIKRQVNREYKHVILTNGAAGACAITLRAYQLQGKAIALTYEPPYFSLYPSIIKAAGLTHQTEVNGIDHLRAVHLVDSPSNPDGVIRDGDSDLLPVIWDAVYGNRICARFNRTIPHDVLVGSYSKLTGLNGIRIGWIATNDTLLFERIKELVTAEYCGLSVPSILILNQVLPGYDWESFEKGSLASLDQNRTEWQKLEKFFNYKPVADNGMFYYAAMDKHCQDLFNKAGVMWRPGSRMGTTDDFGRFNIGQSCDLIRQAVALVLKEDRTK